MIHAALKHKMAPVSDEIHALQIRTPPAAACYFAARWNGEPHREAATIGALMNARGLMELSILNIGRDFGVITDALFSMMVIMAIATTLMASPLFELLYGKQRDALLALADRKEEALAIAFE